MEMKKQKKSHKKLIKLFELQDFLQVIDRDVNGNPIKIGNPAFSTLDKMRLAENIKDFEEIYNRELTTVGSNIVNISSYITRCKKRVNDKVEVYEKMCEECKHKQDDKLLDTAVSYVIFLDSKISPPQNLDVCPTVPEFENELFDTGFNFKNNFDNVSEITIYKYFTKELVDKKYLTKEKLEEYLQFAFQDNKKSITKFSFDKINTQREIIHVFYEYYKTIAQKPYSKKKVYLELLTNYFTGYNYKTIESNFSK